MGKEKPQIPCTGEAVADVNNRPNILSTRNKNMTARRAARCSTAASFLAKSADGIGSSPNKATTFEKCSEYPHKQNCNNEKRLHQTSERIHPNSPHKRLFDVSSIKPMQSLSPTLKNLPQNAVQSLVQKLQNNARSQEIHTNAHRSTAAETNSSEDFSVMVAVRVRPFNQREKELGAKLCVLPDGNQVVVNDSSGALQTFVYNHFFWSFDKTEGSFSSQQDVYAKFGLPLLNASLEGYNTCLFAYGQTGSGKSYTIMGLHEDTGIIPRFCKDLFYKLQLNAAQQTTFHIQVSYFEIYNEKIHDLLVSSQVSDGSEQIPKQVLKVREHPKYGPFVEGLSKFSVNSFGDVLAWLEVGNRQRATAATGMNDKSSRSHSVFTLSLVQSLTEELEGEIHESSTTSRINLVDLAGSERSSTALTCGQRLKEGASINKSLLTLGKVISALSERSHILGKKQKRLFVPYRDSSLTWILRESLGGNSRTAMIATISPADCHYEETLSTLRYAQQAKNIVNVVKINEDPNARLIRELKAEVVKLKEASKKNDIDPDKFKASLQEVAALRKQLGAAEKEKAEVQEKWKKKLEISEKHKIEEINELKRAGVSFKVDNQLPNLVNLNEDPQLSELLLYMIKHGSTRVGKKGTDCDIQLNGALVAEFHCTIINTNEVVTIVPNTNSTVYVNGEIIESSVVLHHGDRVIIGGDHFFRFNNPIELNIHGVNRKSNDGPKDFEFAKYEFIERQNERMAVEIEAAQLRVKKEMLQEIEAAKKDAEQQILHQKNCYESEINQLQSQLLLDGNAKKELETIREQKQLLEKEVNVTRHNREIEANILKNQDKNSLKSEQIKTQVLADLEAERQKLSKEVERMQQKSKTKVPIKVKPNESPLRLSLLLKEANNISRNFDQNTIFSHHDDKGLHFETNIRVQNTKLGIWTLWTFSKFEEKLECMRDVYSKGDVDDEEVMSIFNDPSDDWQEVFKHSPKETPTSSSCRLSRRLSSLVLARASPALQKSLIRLNEEQTTPDKQGSINITALTNFCKGKIEAGSHSLDSLYDSQVDKVLVALEKLDAQVQTVSFNYSAMEGLFQNPLFFQTVIDLTFHMEMIISFSESIKYHCLNMDNNSPSILRPLRQLEKALKKLSACLIKLLHGCQLGIDSLVQESVSNISHLIPNISKYFGALSVATSLSVSVFEEENQHKLGHRIKHAFLQGGDTFMKKILSGAANKLGQVTSSQNSLPPLLHTLRVAVADLFHNCIKLQNEVYESSLPLQMNSVPPVHYSKYLEQIRKVVEEIGNLVSNILLVKPEDFDLSTTETDLRIRIEMLWRPISRISDVLKQHFEPIIIGFESSNNCNNSNNKGSGESILICAIDESAKQAHIAVRNIIKYVDPQMILKENLNKDENYNKRGRSRVLPTSPNLLENKTISSSTLVKDTVAKWLSLADYSCTEFCASTQSVFV